MAKTDFRVGSFLRIPKRKKGARSLPWLRGPIDLLDPEKGDTYGVAAGENVAVFVANRGRGHFPLTRCEIPADAVLIPDEEEKDIPDPIYLALGVARFALPVPE